MHVSTIITFCEKVHCFTYRLACVFRDICTALWGTVVHCTCIVTLCYNWTWFFQRSFPSNLTMVLVKVYLAWFSPYLYSGTSLGFLWSEQVMSIWVFLVLGTLFQMFEIKEKIIFLGGVFPGQITSHNFPFIKLTTSTVPSDVFTFWCISSLTLDSQFYLPGH